MILNSDPRSLAIKKVIGIGVFLLALLIFILWGLGKALFPLLISAILAYICFPPIKKLEHRGVPRTVAVIGIFLILVILNLGLWLTVIPMFIADLRSFVLELPGNVVSASERLRSFLASYGYAFNLTPERIRSFITDMVAQFWSQIFQQLNASVKTIFSNVMVWILALFNFFLIPLFFFFIINDYEKLRSQIKAYLPHRYSNEFAHVAATANTILSGFLRGQLSVALTLAALYSIGLTIVGLKFGFLIGLMTGLLSVIPYVGFSTGFGLAIIVALANYEGPGPLLGAIVVFLIIQALESFVITPRLVGNRVGLSPLTTLLALIVAGNAFGLIGMLFAIPITAMLKKLVTYLRENYLQAVHQLGE